MAKAAIPDYSITPASNTDVDGLDSTGATGLVKSGDNYVRSLMAHAKANANDLGGVNTPGGTGDAITLTLSASPTALVDGYRVVFNAPAANTTAATITVTNALGAVIGTNIKIRKWVAGVETALAANDIPGANAITELIYDSARDTGTGAFMLPTPPAGITFATNAQAVTGTSTVLATNPNNLSAVRARRNLFDNPALQISTVNGNTAGTTNGYEIADGWKVYRVTSAGTITAQRVQSTTPKGAPDRGRITITVADASLAAGEYLIATKTITGREVAHLKYGTASALQTNFRALIKFPAGTYAYSIQNTAANRSYVGLFTPAVANTDEIITANIVGDATGTWPIDASQWTFNIVLAAGSTFQGTTGWQAGNILGTSAVTNGMATGSAVFEFGELGWHADPESTGVAPAWELPSAAMEIHNTQGGDVGRLLAWVRYNGVTNTILGSGNISSVTDNGNGDLTLNFTRAMPDANYTVVGACIPNNSGNYGYIFNPGYSAAPTTTSVRCSTSNLGSSLADCVDVHIAIYR